MRDKIREGRERKRQGCETDKREGCETEREREILWHREMREIQRVSRRWERGRRWGRQGKWRQSRGIWTVG